MVVVLDRHDSLLPHFGFWFKFGQMPDATTVSSLIALNDRRTARNMFLVACLRGEAASIPTNWPNHLDLTSAVANVVPGIVAKHQSLLQDWLLLLCDEAL